jgi:AraC family transcriptional regulator
MKTALAVNLLHRYSNYKGEIKEYQDGMPKYKLKQAIDYIHAHLYENLSLQEIAAIVNMSPCYFVMLFKRSTGLTVNQYIIRCRLSRAKHLLRLPNLKIIEVAQAVGVESHSYFTQAFRTHTGVTPTEYREDRA